MTTYAKDEVEALTRGLLDAKLGQLTDQQRENFWKIWKHSPTPDRIPTDKLHMCIDLCNRTLALKERAP